MLTIVVFFASDKINHLCVIPRVSNMNGNNVSPTFERG